MFLARVQGHVVASQKDAAINGMKLLVVEPLKVNYDASGSSTPGQSESSSAAPGSSAALEVTGRAIVAVDRIGAGEGQIVLIVQGSSARLMEGCSKMPIDAVVVGLVDEAVVKGKKLLPL